MKLPDRLYNILKWIGLILFPALAWFIGKVGVDIGIVDPDKVVRILNAVGTLLGMLIGVSSYSFSKENVIVIEPTNNIKEQYKEDTEDSEGDM